MKKRYFVRSGKSGTSPNVVDRLLRLAIATCTFRESARFIARVLNEDEERNAQPALQARAPRTTKAATKPATSEAPEASE